METVGLSRASEVCTVSGILTNPPIITHSHLCEHVTDLMWFHQGLHPLLRNRNGFDDWVTVIAIHIWERRISAIWRTPPPTQRLLEELEKCNIRETLLSCLLCKIESITNGRLAWNNTSYIHKQLLGIVEEVEVGREKWVGRRLYSYPIITLTDTRWIIHDYVLYNYIVCKLELC